ncbi:MAG: methyltransferase domain-containing protein [Actinomycetota bacterium]|nr:methyltransferase domain-containing protein [Actinomycetota bacterium]
MSTHTGPREWDADTYDRVSQPQSEWAEEVLERLPLQGHETVLDAGCGSGRVTERLVERLPAGRVLGVDASADMVRKARERLDGRATVWQADLTGLEVDEPVDAVFSNAVFHWVADHELLFGRLNAVLRPGGRLVAQCGGKGNIASLRKALEAVMALEPFAEHFEDFGGLWNFASDSETGERLRRSGLDRVRCWLETKTVRPERAYEYMRVVTLGPHLARLPGGLKGRFTRSVLDRMGDPLELDYVRLNIDARKRS